jgi:hypothetical protein
MAVQFPTSTSSRCGRLSVVSYQLSVLGKSVKCGCRTTRKDTLHFPLKEVPWEVKFTY